MKKLAILASFFALSAAPAFAVGQTKFSEDMTLPAGASVAVNVVLSPDLAARADAMPEKLSERSGARGLRQGFAGNGFYGERDLNLLIKDMSKELSGDLTRAGYALAENADLTLRVTIIDARNNRPTLRQLSVQPSLSYQSLSAGGAEVKAELVNRAGDVIGTAQYGRFETSPFDGVAVAGTWTDAERVFSRFSSRLVKNLN